MDENFEEKTLDVSTQSCETHVFTTEYFKANVYTDVVKRLNEMIDCCKSVGGEQDFIANSDRILTVILAFYCLGIIPYDKVKDYIKRLYPGVK